MRATPRTPRSCDGPRGSLSMRPLFVWGWLANVHSRRGSRACVARIDRRVTVENNRCVSAPHDDMHRRRGESRGWRGLLRRGRVVGSRREDGGSLAAIGLVRVSGCKRQTWWTGKLLSFLVNN